MLAHLPPGNTAAHTVNNQTHPQALPDAIDENPQLAAGPPTPGVIRHTHTYKKRANICIATLNINGTTTPMYNMNHQIKWAHIYRMMKVENIVVLAVQEMHLDEKLLTKIKRSFNKYLTIENSSIPENPTQSGGVTIVLNKALINPEELSSHMLIQGRAVLTKLQWANGKKLVILNIYALNNRHSHSDFWKQIELERWSRRLPKPDILLL